MDEKFQRTELLFGESSVKNLSSKRVAVFGVGGVGGFCVEALARSGVGSITLIDGDTVHISNVNRQIVALQSTLGQFKAEVFKNRIADINPQCSVQAVTEYFVPDNAESFDFTGYDYVVDAVDMVTAKIQIILRAQAAGVGIISAMGAGNKTDATRFKVADVYQTSVCPLARVMRRELKKRGVKSLKVVYSDEEPLPPKLFENGKAVPASCAFVPSVAGLIIAGEVIKDLLNS